MNMNRNRNMNRNMNRNRKSAMILSFKGIGQKLVIGSTWTSRERSRFEPIVIHSAR